MGFAERHIMERRRIWSLETAFDFFLVVLGIAVIILSLFYGLGTVKKPGPGLYPFFLGLFIAIFSAALLKSELKLRTPPSILNRADARTLLFMMAGFFLWILMIPFLGYVIMTLIVTYGICKIMKLEGFWKPFSLSTGTALFIYLLFDYWLYIDLPKGILG